MMVRHIRLDRRQFYLFEGLGINSLFWWQCGHRWFGLTVLRD